jgi:hypothetical protein
MTLVLVVSMVSRACSRSTPMVPRLRIWFLRGPTHDGFNSRANLVLGRFACGNEVLTYFWFRLDRHYFAGLAWRNPRF